MEHREWCGNDFKTGFYGKRIAIAGHSHHSDKPDHEELTRETIKKVIAGEPIQFFRSVASYFGCDSPSHFWPRVLFFNFLPTIVGRGDERYGYGTNDQIKAGRDRVLRILEDHQPDLLFAFSAKAWKEFPPTLQDQERRPDDEVNWWHQYATTTGHEVQAVGLRHPQWANALDMRYRVQNLLTTKARSIAR